MPLYKSDGITPINNDKIITLPEIVSGKFLRDDNTWQENAGTQGPKGDQGATGVKGDKGDTGNQGNQGIQGVQGIQGIPGIIPDPIVTALGTTGSIVVPMAAADVFTITPTGACTFTTTSFKSGKRITFIILTSGTTSRTLTWSTGFKPLSTLSTGTVTGKYFSLTFICVGSLWIETGARLAAV